MVKKAKISREMSADLEVPSENIHRKIQVLPTLDINPISQKIPKSQVDQIMEWLLFFDERHSHSPSSPDEPALLIKLQVDLGLCIIEKIMKTISVWPNDPNTLPILDFLQQIVEQFSKLEPNVEKLEFYANWIQLLYAICKNNLPCCKEEIRLIIDKFQGLFITNLNLGKKSINNSLVIYEMFLQINEISDQTILSNQTREQFILNLVQSYFVSNTPQINRGLTGRNRHEPVFNTFHEILDLLETLTFETRDEQVEWTYGFISLLLGIQYLSLRYYNTDSPSEYFFSQLTNLFDRLYSDYLKIRGFIQKERVNYFFLQLLWNRFIIDYFWGLNHKILYPLIAYEEFLPPISKLIEKVFDEKVFQVKWQGDYFPIKKFFSFSRQQIQEEFRQNPKLKIQQYFFNHKLGIFLFNFCIEWTQNNTCNFYQKLDEIYNDGIVTNENEKELENLLIPSNDDRNVNDLIKKLTEYQTFWTQLVNQYDFTYDIKEKIRKNISLPIEFLLKRISSIAQDKISSGKAIVFFSYAFKNSEFFKIDEIADDLLKHKEVEDVYYSQKDVRRDFVDYMESALTKSNVCLRFCSVEATGSRYVKDEFASAYKREIPIICVYTDPKDIPALRQDRYSHLVTNIPFNRNDIIGTSKEIFDAIIRVLKNQ